jgi:hypothetical protein
MGVIRVQVAVPATQLQSEPVPPPLLPVWLIETPLMPAGRVSVKVSVPPVDPGPLGFDTVIV